MEKRLKVASLIEELIITLQNEADIYQELLPIAEKKTRIIVENNLQELQNITAVEQDMIDKITALEKKREDVVHNIGTVLGKDPKTLNISTIISVLGKQPKEQKQLANLHDTLKQTVHRMVQINNHNRSLIEQSLELIEYNMNFIQSTRMSQGNHSYNRGASAFDISPQQAGMFDAKQ